MISRYYGTSEKSTSSPMSEIAWIIRAILDLIRTQVIKISKGTSPYRSSRYSDFDLISSSNSKLDLMILNSLVSSRS